MAEKSGPPHNHAYFSGLCAKFWTGCTCPEPESDRPAWWRWPGNVNRP